MKTKNIYLFEYLLPIEMITLDKQSPNKWNYKGFLCEIMNNSLFFYKENNGTLYIQNNNDDFDCYANNYKMDFGLLATKDMLEPLNDSKDKLRRTEIKIFLQNKLVIELFHQQNK